MTEFFLAVGVGIALTLTVVNLVVLVALAARVRDGGTPATAVSHTAALPALGQRVAAFQARALDGTAVSEQAVAHGDALVGFLSPGCGSCTEAVQRLRALGAAGDARLDGLTVLLFVLGGPAEGDEVAAGLPAGTRVVLTQHRGEPSVAFGGIAAYPALLRLRDGLVTGAGNNLDTALGATTSGSGGAAGIGTVPGGATSGSTASGRGGASGGTAPGGTHPVGRRG
jgi:hypothetical protein